MYASAIFPLPLPGEEDVGIVTTRGEQEVFHDVPVVPPGEKLAITGADVGDVVAHISKREDGVELREREHTWKGDCGDSALAEGRSVV